MAKKAYIGEVNAAWRDLPSGYTQVEYIQSSGTQCINTGFKPNQDTRVVVDIQVVSFDGYAPLFGARVASKNAEYATWAIAETDIQDGYGTQAESKLVAEALKRNIIDKNKNMLYVGGVLLKTHTVQTFAPNYPIFLFNINTAGSTTGSFKTFARLYSSQIYDNGTLARDFVPCINPSGTAGLYDMVNGVFYGNAGTGSFIAGEPVHREVAHKISPIYLGIDDLARMVKKAYIGIGDVARPCWSMGEVAYYGTINALSKGRSGLAAASVGDYALFGGGGGLYSADYNCTVDAYSGSLTKVDVLSLSTPGLYDVCAASVGNHALFAGRIGSVTQCEVIAYDENLTQSFPTDLSRGRRGIATTTNGKYALFGGGYDYMGYSKTVDAYNENLTRTTPTALSQGRDNFAATYFGKYALFGGGYGPAPSLNTVDAYDDNLTRTTPAALSQARRSLAATSVGKHALFGGGSASHSPYDSYVVDAYDDNLTRTTPTALSQGRSLLAATSLQNYALFGGGDYSTSSVDVYDERLTRTNPNRLSYGRESLAATSVGNYALFAGGYSTVYYDDEDGESYEEEVYYSTVDAYTVV